MGLEEDKSLRKVYDGFTYFGCKKAIKRVGNRSMFGSGDKTQMGATGISMDESKYTADTVNSTVINILVEGNS